MKKIIILSALILASLPITAEAEANANNFRPRAKGLTFGLGVGMSVPSSGLDTYIYRLRVNPKLTIEPMLNIGKTTSEDSITTTMNEIDPDTGDETGSTTTSTSVTNIAMNWLGGGVSLRYRVAKRGNTDVQAIGGVGYLKMDSETSIEGITGSSIEESTSLSANVGVGMENFFAPKWSAGVDVTTPIYSQSTSSSTPVDTLLETTSTGTGTGTLLSPSFRLMLTHYF